MTEYPNVKFHHQSGTLSFTDKGLAFVATQQQHRPHVDERSHFWPWDSVQGSYFSQPVTACFHGAKFVFVSHTHNDNDKKKETDPPDRQEKEPSVLFTFPNREDFERAAHDVVQHGITVAPLKMSGTLYGGH